MLAQGGNVTNRDTLSSFPMNCSLTAQVFDEFSTYRLPKRMSVQQIQAKPKPLRVHPARLFKIQAV